MILKIRSINMTDSKGNEYFINQNQVEFFPLIGGESANMIVTESWNQHGDTPTNALMEPFEGELIFIIKTRNMRPEQIAQERRKITNICNPLNGTVKMTVTLNDDSIFHRDITFSSAPVFPIGLENRNQDWQKVQLLYTANNPFWYAETEILETFQGVEPLFYFPFTMSPLSPIIFGNVIPSNVAINEGQVDAPVVIEIKGACINPRIDNETTGEFIGFTDLTMNAGDVLVIDTTFGQKKVELNKQNVFNKLDFASTFFNLQIGENSIDFTDETGSTETTIHFLYKNLYITI
jgi:phage-related protein